LVRGAPQSSTDRNPPHRSASIVQMQAVTANHGKRRGIVHSSRPGGASRRARGSDLGSRSAPFGELSATGSKLGPASYHEKPGERSLGLRASWPCFPSDSTLLPFRSRLSDGHPLQSGTECNRMGCARTPSATPSNSRPSRRENTRRLTKQADRRRTSGRNRVGPFLSARRSGRVGIGSRVEAAGV
jgi:hypothetical protein